MDKNITILWVEDIDLGAVKMTDAEVNASASLYLRGLILTGQAPKNIPSVIVIEGEDYSWETPTQE